jgi:Glu-tRNA(Gln) amidotransferase subunit E-like FAD-binding protein
LPGANRMYPDTDLPPMAIPEARLERIAAQLPDYPWDREARYQKLGLHSELIAALFVSPRADLFLRIVEELSTDPVLAAVVLCQRLKSFRRKDLSPDRLGDDEIFEVFKAHADGLMARDGVVKLIRHMLERLSEDSARQCAPSEVLDSLSLGVMSDKQMHSAAGAVIEEVDPGRFDRPAKLQRYLMGTLMQ